MFFYCIDITFFFLIYNNKEDIFEVKEPLYCDN